MNEKLKTPTNGVEEYIQKGCSPLLPNKVIRPLFLFKHLWISVLIVMLVKIHQKTELPLGIIVFIIGKLQ